MTVEELPLIKVTSEEQELHEARLGASAETAFDVHAYVDDFNDAVVGAYRRRHRRREPPRRRRRGAQHHPAGHRRRPRLQPPRAAHPRLRRRSAASAAWPASAPAPTRRSSASRSRHRSLEPAIAGVRRRPARPDVERDLAGALRPDARSTRDVPARRRHRARGRSGSSSTRRTARAAANASRSAHALGYDALRMIDKVAGEPTAATRRRALRPRRALLPHRCRRRRPSTATRRRSPTSCSASTPSATSAAPARAPAAARRRRSGCSSPRRARSTAPSRWASSRRPAATPCSAAPTRSTRTSCRGRTRCSRTRPADRARHPRPMGPGSATRSGACGSSAATGRCTTSASSRCRGWSPRAPTSRCSCSTRRSTRTPVARRRPRRSAARSRSSRRSARAIHGRPEPRKELGRILVAHGEVYVAQTTPAHINHFYRAVMEANAYPGPAVMIAYSPCHARARHRRRRVEPPGASSPSTSRAFPLFTYDPRRGDRLAERLSLQGNPALRDDWATRPDGSAVDFLAFARTEGRFAPHFAADGDAERRRSLATQADRLANWRTAPGAGRHPLTPASATLHGSDGPDGPPRTTIRPSCRTRRPA